ncbi:MAG: diguanylate cyclase, partial [Candidatus Choladocola sp.]|nr:diguanylate cyclase [Candidatus Choladocola sp.]
MASYSWVSVIALLGYLFLLIAFASAKKNKVINSFIVLLLILIMWSGGSFLMRVQFWPSINFWHYVSIAGMMLLPYGFLRFFCDFLEEKRKYCRNFWLIFFSVCYVINLFTEFFIPTPQVHVSDAGTTVFVYTYPWPIYIIFGICVVILIQISYLFFRCCRGDILVFRQLRPVLIGIGFVVLGNGISTLGVFAGIPVDIISGVVFVYFLFYALYKKRMFKLTLLLSKGNCYALSILISGVIFYYLIAPIRKWITKYLHLNETYTLLLIALLIVICVYLLYIIMKQFLDTLFVKEEQIQAETIKEFSYSVSRTLQKETILSELADVIQRTTGTERIYICINNGEGEFVLEKTASPLDQKSFSMGKDHPLIQYMEKHEGCLLMDDFKRTNNYRSMWDQEKKQLEDWRVACLAPMKDSSDLVGIVMLSGKEKGYSFDDFSLLMSVCSVCSMAVKNSKMYEQAYDESRKDDLTGLYNRKRFYEVIEEEFEKNRDHSLALIMLNVDDFKLYNQLYGAQEGDRALQKIAAIIRATTADRGIAFRMTGKEFAVLLPSYDIYSAKVLAESVAGQVRRMNANNDLYSLK